MLTLGHRRALLSGGTFDPLAGITFALRLQTHRGDGAPLGLYQDEACTIPAILDSDPVAGIKNEFSGAIITTQADPQKQGLLMFDGGVPTLYTDGVDDCYPGTMGVSLGCLTVVLKSDIGNAGGVYSDSNAFGSHHPFGDGNIYEGFNTTVRVDGVNPSGALYDWAVYQAYNVAGVHKIRVNGVEINSASRTSRANTDFTIGSSTNSLTGNYNGQIIAIFIHDPADALTVETYTATLIP